MDRNKRDLEALVASQKEQLARYEKRLKDVVAAYKGLLKEKEALESSLAVTANNKNDTTTTSNTGESESSSSDLTADGACDGGGKKDELQNQIMTLMNSLATLSAEKSRMEASFQADKKQLRVQLTEKDQSIAELQRKLKENIELGKANVEEMKAKWIIERQEREKESNNQMIMIRELQKLYADERHLKESIEMQLNNFKTQFASNEAENSRVRELQTQLKEARSLLKQFEASRKENCGDDASSSANDAIDSSTVLQQVRREMQQLKDQHAIAIKTEQRRVQLAEEESRKAVALHEDRVANLEARLAELSCTVGNYDRLRQQDQESIQTLKSKLYELERSAENGDAMQSSSSSSLLDNSRDELKRKGAFGHMHQDISLIVDEIMRLKKLLMSENSRSANPIDVSKVFAVGADHSQCHAELKRVEKEFNEAKLEIDQLRENIQVQKAHISTLQEKVKILNRNIDEQEIELKQQNERQRQAVKEERSKWKSVVNELENDQRQRINELEQQLQKQRQRSLQLLDEKEQEIKALQTSFEVFHNAAVLPTMCASVSGGNIASSAAEHYAVSSDDGESIEGGQQRKTTSELKSKKLSIGESCHMLHYANEIARKDIEIAGLRKAKYSAETALRRAIQDKVTAQEELNDKIEVLEEQVDRLERCKTREGANLEYLKNVIISFIATKDADGKRHMMNAISAVLQFTPAEIQTINAAFHKK